MTDKQLISRDISNYIDSAGTAMNRKDWQAANGILKQGLSAMGDRYMSPEVIDGTGQKLTLAQAEESAGNLEMATNIRLRMLVNRFEMFKEKSN